MKTKKIILLGYMGSGKTSVGRLLNVTLNLPFYDLDNYLEKKLRPLVSHLNDFDDIQEFVGKHLFERNQFYTKADFKVMTKKKSIKNIATELENLLA